MKAVHVLAAVVLVLLLIGQVRAGGRAEFNAQGFFLWIRVGRFQIQILPMKPKPKKKPSPPKKPKKPKKEKPPTPLPEKVGGALEYAQALLPVALEAAKGMWRTPAPHRFFPGAEWGASPSWASSALFPFSVSWASRLFLPSVRQGEF